MKIKIKKIGTITVNVSLETDEHNKILFFHRNIDVDGKTVYSDKVGERRYMHGADALSVFIRLAEEEAGYRGKVANKIQSPLRQSWVRKFQILQLCLQCLVLKAKIFIRKRINGGLPLEPTFFN